METLASSVQKIWLRLVKDFLLHQLLGLIPSSYEPAKAKPRLNLLYINFLLLFCIYHVLQMLENKTFWELINLIDFVENSRVLLSYMKIFLVEHIIYISWYGMLGVWDHRDLHMTHSHVLFIPSYILKKLSIDKHLESWTRGGLRLLNNLSFVRHMVFLSSLNLMYESNKFVVG